MPPGDDDEDSATVTVPEDILREVLEDEKTIAVTTLPSGPFDAPEDSAKTRFDGGRTERDVSPPGDLPFASSPGSLSEISTVPGQQPQRPVSEPKRPAAVAPPPSPAADLALLGAQGKPEPGTSTRVLPPPPLRPSARARFVQSFSESSISRGLRTIARGNTRRDRLLRIALVLAALGLSLAIMLALIARRERADAAPAQTGTLSVTCFPACHVWIDGEDTRQDAPVVGKVLAIGSHRLLVKDPASGLKHEVEVKLGAGDRVHKRIYLAQQYTEEEREKN
jgi:hypothetical protein